MSTVERVHRVVLEQMLRGELLPGSWLRQDEVAARLGVSKIPVREALQRLAAARLVTFEAGRGAQVRPLTAADAEEVYGVRVAIEPLLLARAVPRLTAVDLARAEVALADGGSGDGSAGAGSAMTANWAFHQALYQPAGWARALDLVEGLHAAVAPYVRLYTEELGGADASEQEHRAMLAACRAGDTDTAVAVLRGHLEEAAAALAARLG